MDKFKITIRNGIVRYWDVYQQGWVRAYPEAIPANILATLDGKDRSRIGRAINKAQAAK